MELNRLKINRIVEYIQQFPFEYECWEVQNDLNQIRRDYSIFDTLNNFERELLVTELYPMAESFEIAEVIRLSAQHEPELVGLKCPDLSLLQIKILRKILLSQIKDNNSSSELEDKKKLLLLMKGRSIEKSAQT